MKRWNEENLSAIQEYPFDFNRYIEEKLREIDDLDERRFAKTVLLEGLGKVIECAEEKYRRLEKRVYEEIEMEESQYETVITVIGKEFFDPTNTTLFPVIPEEVGGGCPMPLASAEAGLYAGTIFLKADEKKCAQFLATETFPGFFMWKGERKEASFKICRAERYRDRIEQLYKVFQDNHIPWETVHTGILDKFYDVYLTGYRDETENFPEPETEVLEQVDVCWGEFELYICHSMVPLWNIEWIDFDSTDFMMPCIDGIYYEHEFLLPDTGKEDGYLIQPNDDILEIRHEDGKIIIKSRKETFEGWQALHMVQKETVRSLDYTEPFLTNHKRDSFFKRIQTKNHVQLMTKADLFRRIMELDIREYIEVSGYEICDDAARYPAVEGMNWFVRDELFPMESRKVLLLKFKEQKPGHYLNDSMVRYVVSQLQLEISEYRCVGIIMESVGK